LYGVSGEDEVFGFLEVDGWGVGRTGRRVMGVGMNGSRVKSIKRKADVILIKGMRRQADAMFQRIFGLPFWDRAKIAWMVLRGRF
jgi:hypothetical protein